MSDPLSIVASSITVGALAGNAVKACQELQDITRRFLRAPKDIQRYGSMVQSLQATLAGVARLHYEPQIVDLLVPSLKDRLAQCSIDLWSMADDIKSISSRLEDGHRRRTAARVRWSLGTQKWDLDEDLKQIKIHYDSIQGDLLVLVIQLLIRKDIVSQYTGLTGSTEGAFSSGTPIEPIVCAKPTCNHWYTLRATFVRCLKTSWLDLSIRLGQLIIPHQQVGTPLNTQERTRSCGYGIVLSSALFRYSSARYELNLGLHGQWNQWGIGSGVQWSLSQSAVVSYGSELRKIVSSGDIISMQKAFSSRRSTARDVLPNAVTHGQYEMVKFLLQNGANVNATDRYGETPLHAAVTFSKSDEICRTLLDHGADPWNRNLDGQTPLHTYFTHTVVRLLQYHEDILDFADTDNYEMTLIHYLAWSSRTSIDVFRRYHERSGITLSTVDHKGRSLLHFAADRGNCGIVDYLCSTFTAEISLRDRHGKTALHYAAATKRAPQVISTLISYGADFKATDCDGATPLHAAAQQQNFSAMRELLLNGKSEDLYVRDRFGRTPVSIVALGKTSETSHFLDELEHNHPGASSTSNIPPSHCPRLAATLPVADISLPDCGDSLLQENTKLKTYTLCAVLCLLVVVVIVIYFNSMLISGF